MSFRAAILSDCVLLVLRGEALGLFLGVFSSSVSSPSRVVRDNEVVRAVDEIRPRPSEGICGGRLVINMLRDVEMTQVYYIYLDY